MKATDARQLKAARVILGMTIDELADKAGLHRNSIMRVEAHKTLPTSAYAADLMQEALEALGIVFEGKEGLVGLFFSASTQRARKPYARRLAK